MNPRHLTRIAFLAASKRLGGVRVYGRRSVFKCVYRKNCSFSGAGQLRQEINALGHSTFHECDLHELETYTWGHYRDNDWGWDFYPTHKTKESNP